MTGKLRCAQLYVADGRPAVIAAMHFNSAGIYYEQDGASTVADWHDAAALAGGLWLSLERFSFREANLRNRKKTDWPSYRASGCRSVREFEELYLCIRVGAFNEAALLYDAYAQPAGESDIGLHVTINRNASDEEVGRLLLRLYDSCRRWTEDWL